MTVQQKCATEGCEALITVDALCCDRVYCFECDRKRRHPKSEAAPYGLLCDPTHCDDCAEQVGKAEDALNSVSKDAPPEEFEQWWGTYRPTFDTYYGGEDEHKKTARSAWTAGRAALSGEKEEK
jgi:thiaminase